MPFQKGHKAYLPYSKRIAEKEKEEKLEEKKLTDLSVIQTPTQQTVGEVLIDATNKVIDVYNKVAQSIKDEDIVKMDINKKINALQKLSYLHNATKKTRPSNLNFIKIDTSKKTAEELEDALLNMNQEEEQEQDE